MPEINPVHLFGEERIFISIKFLYSRERPRFLHSDPYYDAINSFTESAIYTLSF